MDDGGDVHMTSGEDADSCDMVTNAPIPPDAEVLNTYGETLTNAQLLARYGFVLDSNDNDVIAWDWEELCDFADDVKGCDLDHDHGAKGGERSGPSPCRRCDASEGHSALEQLREEVSVLGD